MTERGKPEDEDLSDPDALERAVDAEHYRRWREYQAAGWAAVPDKDAIRDELTAPERERREAEEAKKREQREAQEAGSREHRDDAAYLRG